MGGGGGGSRAARRARLLPVDNQWDVVPCCSYRSLGYQEKDRQSPACARALHRAGKKKEDHSLCGDFSGRWLAFMCVYCVVFCALYGVRVLLAACKGAACGYVSL